MNKKNFVPSLNAVNSVERVSQRANRMLRFGATFLSALSAMTVPAFAADTNSIVNGVASGLGSAWELLKGIALPIAAIAAVFCAFYIFTGGEKGMEKAKKIGLYLVIGLAIVYLGPVIVEVVSGWFSSSGNTNVFGTAQPTTT